MQKLITNKVVERMTYHSRHHIFSILMIQIYIDWQCSNVKPTHYFNKYLTKIYKKLNQHYKVRLQMYAMHGLNLIRNFRRFAKID